MSLNDHRSGLFGNFVCPKPLVFIKRQKDTIIRLETNHLNITNDNIINWPANGDAIRACRMKGQSESLCRNYVKVLLGKNTTEVNSTLAEGDSVNIFVCGTNAFKPVCSWRKSDSLNTIESEEDASGKCPYNPSWNTTSLFTSRAPLKSLSLT
uniref:Sema domain-containing protein n=1 Tax=Tetranychus urticae TaxID=32264 RepID=T1JRR6_TETUR